MSLAQLQIHNLRNIKSAKLELHPQINLFSGFNGSGKTSLLESVYLLGSGHSFRTREILPLISSGEDSLTVFARTDDEQSVSIQKSLHSPTLVRLNGFSCHSSSELAHFLPCQVFYQDIFQIIDAGPAIRRSVMDWGLFHVKHDYHIVWKSYKRALKQRNTLLKQRALPKELLPWNIILTELAEQLHQARESYFLNLRPEFENTLKELSSFHCSLSYYKGWDRRESGKSLSSIFEENYQKDVVREFTQYGPHQADLFVTSEEFSAKQYLSRGQQKILLFALKLAQAKLTPQSCVYLCDDLVSELDNEHVERLLNFIFKTKGQFFITSTSPMNLPLTLGKDFSTFNLIAGNLT